MEGAVIFLKGDRIIYRHEIVVRDGDFSKGVSDAIESFQRNFADFDLWDEAVSFRVRKAGNFDR